jgi:hypothetical protein
MSRREARRSSAGLYVEGGADPRWSAPGISFSAMTRRRILLIEDEESIAEPLAAALAPEGFEVATAAIAAVGLEALRANPPDAVLLDVMLPDGAETAPTAGDVGGLAGGGFPSWGRRPFYWSARAKSFVTVFQLRAVAVSPKCFSQKA